MDETSCVKRSLFLVAYLPFFGSLLRLLVDVSKSMKINFKEVALKGVSLSFEPLMVSLNYQLQQGLNIYF
jgi:hypothetical protein